MKKQAVLRNVLEHWGHLMNTLEQDPDFKRFVQELGERLYDRTVNRGAHDSSSKSEDPERAEVLNELSRLFPAAIALGGLTEHLASRRLLRPLNDVAEAAKSDERLEITIASAFMLYSVKEAGWPKALRALLENRRNIWVVRNFLLPLLMNDYALENVSEDDDEDLRNLCAEIVVNAYRYEHDGQRRAHREQIRQSLKRARLDQSHPGAEHDSDTESAA